MATDISVQTILDYAITLEQRAADLYADLAGRSPDGAIKDVFEEFSRQELGHKKKLEEVRSGRQVLSVAPSVTDLKISDYTVPVTLGDRPSWQDILLFAIEQEKNAMVLYTDLAARMADDATKNVFLGLAAEEAVHKNRFEIEYDDSVLQQN